MRKWLWILLFPLAAQAAGEGAWQASSIGLTLNHRGESISSRPLSASEPVSGQMTLVARNYTLTGPTPAGLRVRLCSLTRCAEIEDKVAPPGLQRGVCSGAFTLYLGSARRWTSDPGAESSAQRGARQLPLTACLFTSLQAFLKAGSQN